MGFGKTVNRMENCYQDVLKILQQFLIIVVEHIIINIFFHKWQPQIDQSASIKDCCIVPKSGFTSFVFIFGTRFHN